MLKEWKTYTNCKFLVQACSRGGIICYFKSNLWSTSSVWSHHSFQAWVCSKDAPEMMSWIEDKRRVPKGPFYTLRHVEGLPLFSLCESMSLDRVGRMSKSPVQAWFITYWSEHSQKRCGLAPLKVHCQWNTSVHLTNSLLTIGWPSHLLISLRSKHLKYKYRANTDNFKYKSNTCIQIA